MPVPGGEISTSEIWVAPVEPVVEPVVEETPEESD